MLTFTRLPGSFVVSRYWTLMVILETSCSDSCAKPLTWVATPKGSLLQGFAVPPAPQLVPPVDPFTMAKRTPSLAASPRTAVVYIPISNSQHENINIRKVITETANSIVAWPASSLRFRGLPNVVDLAKFASSIHSPHRNMTTKLQ